MELCDKAKTIINSSIKDLESKLIFFVEQCESPVEQIFVVQFCTTLGGTINTYLNRFQTPFGPSPHYDDIFTLTLELQKTIKTVQGSAYRSDILFKITRFWGSKEDPIWGNLIVEIDGHEFHDRSKEQASRDRQRDRELILEGYTVLRFTGSDVYNDPERCVNDVRFQLEDIAWKIIKEYKDKDCFEKIFLGPDYQD